ncbi:MAG TPA: SDR family NAD(P)-dependent oxidoreductase [Candidatus Binataceae bacterium]|nr:SDR family NAD(P)-dependent oxidoreductase [Candidatus Binataceae bacterium]
MAKRLAGKVAVVTGAGRGIGRSEALLLAQQGAKVVVNDLGGRPTGEGADRGVAQIVADEIKAAGGDAVANTDSVATMAGGKAVIDCAIKHFGRLDILINNAGNLRPKQIWEMTEEDWDLVINVHLKGTFTCTRHAAPIFREQRSGVIVNTASESGLGHYGMANYSAAKEGIVGFTRTVARDLGQFNVRVNAIRPRAATRMAIPEVMETIRISQEVLGFPGLANTWVSSDNEEIKPEHPATLAVWLCTEACSNVNGQVFEANGRQIGLWPEEEMNRVIHRPDADWDLDTLDIPATRNHLIGHLTNKFSGKKK